MLSVVDTHRLGFGFGPLGFGICLANGRLQGQYPDKECQHPAAQYVIEYFAKFHFHSFYWLIPMVFNQACTSKLGQPFAATSDRKSVV